MGNKLINIYRFASPQAFYPLAGKMIPWFWTLAAIFGIAGLYIGFLVAPTDAQQGEGYRIIFLHVPASWLSMFIYLVMAFWAGLGLGFNFRLSGMMASALAPTGAQFARDGPHLPRQGRGAPGAQRTVEGPRARTLLRCAGMAVQLESGKLSGPLMPTGAHP